MPMRLHRRSDTFQLPPRAVRNWEEALARLEQGNQRAQQPLDARRLEAQEYTQRLLAAAEAGERWRAALISSLAHDVRSPLTSIVGVLDLITDGCTNRQIGETLFLAEKTVKNYVSILLTKLGMQRRTQAAVYGAQVRGLRPEAGSGRR